jgi:hypothetical protein
MDGLPIGIWKEFQRTQEQRGRPVNRRLYHAAWLNSFRNVYYYPENTFQQADMWELRGHPPTGKIQPMASRTWRSTSSLNV